MREFASHFHVPLSSTAYDETKIRLEWRNFRRHVSLNLSGKEVRVLWKNILSYKRIASKHMLTDRVNVLSLWFELNCRKAV